MELDFGQKQIQVISPQMIQTMEILQMGSQELLDYISEAVQENPVLEVGEHSAQVYEAGDLGRKLTWLHSADRAGKHVWTDPNDDTGVREGYGGVDTGEETLYAHLLTQLRMREPEQRLAVCVNYLAQSLNSDGWLDEDLPTLAKDAGQPLSRMERALQMLQSMEPAGVGARDLKECLRIQLLRRESVDPLALRIVEEYLEALSKNRYGLIARELNADADAVHFSCKLIRSLNPRPGAGFARREEPVYVNPDVIVLTFSDHFELSFNDYFFPILYISAYYSQLLNESSDADVKSYLTGKVHQANWTIRAIEQRRNTVMNCSRSILELQEDFFRKGPGHLAPMSLSDIAMRIQVHESTVSRAIKDKYLQCSMGTYPLSYFFSHGVGMADGDEAVSPDAIKAI